MATIKRTTIESMSAKALISTLSYYNETIFNKNCITFSMFVERCVKENPATHFVNIHYNHKAEGELEKYGFIDDNGDIMTIEQADQSFNAVATIEHAFYHLFESEEEKIVGVLNKAIVSKFL